MLHDVSRLIYMDKIWQDESVSIVAPNSCHKWRNLNICSAEISSRDHIWCIQSGCYGGFEKLDVFNLWDTFWYDQNNVHVPPVLQACPQQCWKQQHIGWRGDCCWKCSDTIIRVPLCFVDARNGVDIFRWRQIRQHRRCTWCERSWIWNPFLWPHKGECWWCDS